MGALFQILVALAIVVACLITVLILYFAGKGLTLLNDMMRQNRASLDKGLSVSLSGIDEAQGYMQLFGDMTSTARDGLDLGVRYSDKGIAFLRSSVFQTGFPVMIWGGLLGAISARSVFTRLFSSHKPQPKKDVIPPPSVQKLQETEATRGTD